MPRRRLCALVLVAMLLATPPAPAVQRYTPPSADIEPLPLGPSCAQAANAEVERGAALLVVLATEDARRAFERATASDPDCALGYWGQAVSHLPSASEGLTLTALEAGAAASRRAAAVVAHTAIERGLVESIAALFTAAVGTPIGARLDAYETRLGELAVAHNDVEAIAILHARAILLRTTLPGDAARVRAQRVVESRFAGGRLPAGAAIALVESVDGAPAPAVANRVADAVGSIRLPQPHHLAMRGLVRAGLWARATQEGERALSLATSSTSPALLYGAQGDFAPEWAIEAYLQQGRRRLARDLQSRLTRDLEATTLDPDLDVKIRRGVTRAVARVALDERSSAPSPANADAGVPDAWPWRFGLGLVAAWHAWPGGDAARLREARQTLAALEAPAGGAADPERELARALTEAVVAASQDEHPQATLLLSHAADLESRLLDSGRLSLPLLPARELAAEIWQRFYRYADAEREARAALERFPHRWRALLTAARAATALERHDAARAAYEQLRALRAEADTADPATEEARRALR